MSTLTSEQINHIRSSVDIVDIIGKYLSLTKKGKNYFCTCPFHSDNTPSLSISPERQIFTCFSCHRTGNIFNFLMEYEHLTFIEAVKYVADIANIKLDITNNIARNVNNNILDIYDLSYKFYTNNMNTNLANVAKDYLYKRNIDDSIIKEFGIGLAVASREALAKVLLKKDFNKKDLLESTLISEDERGFHDFFNNRIVFPLLNVNNKVVGYSGRIFTNTDAPKYINSREHTLFKKGEFLYNYYKAKDDCRKTNTVIVTEGFMDVIRCFTIGVKNVVATMGTAFTKQHIALLKRLASDVVLCFDGDDAGVKAAYASCEELIKHNVVPKIVILDDKLDPDEYILKYGQAKFLDKIDNPLSIMDFKLMYHKKTIDLNSSVDKAAYVTKVINDLNNLNDDVLKEITINKLSKEVDLEIEFIKSKLNSNEKIKIFEVKEVQTDKYTKAQAGLIYYMMNDIETIKMVDNRSLYFPDKNYRLLSQEIIFFYKQNNYIDIADIITDLNSDAISVIGFIETLNFKEDISYEAVTDFINAIEEKNLSDECIRLSKKLESELNEQKKLEISQKIIDLLKRREKNV